MAAGWGEADVTGVRARLDELTRTLPGAEVEASFGHYAYRVRTQRFAWLLVDHHGDGRLALCVKAEPGEQRALVGADPRRYFIPAYVGPRGWVGVLLDPASAPDWDEVAALLRQAWRLSAGKRAVAAYDARRPR